MNISSIALKTENRKNTYSLIYNEKTVSKNTIVNKLHLSLPTTTQNLVALEADGFIVKEGLYESTGGRRATVYKCNDKICLAVGIDLTPNSIEIAAINIYGSIIYEGSLDITFVHSDKYFKTFGKFVNSFLEDKCLKTHKKVLGIGIGIPGIIKPDGNNMLYSEVLRTSKLNLSELTQYVKNKNCFFYHNAEAGAFAEIWNGKITDSDLVITLDNCLCNALILNGQVFHGKLSSGTMEHMILHPHGEPCYCGKKGCVDSYCSASALKKKIKQSNLDEFFISLRNGNEESKAIWDKYLSELALAIDNFRMIIACDIILSGLLQKYLTNEDLEILKKKILTNTTFKNTDFNISIGNCGRKAIIIGAALPLIKDFLKSV